MQEFLNDLSAVYRIEVTSYDPNVDEFTVKSSAYGRDARTDEFTVKLDDQEITVDAGDLADLVEEWDEPDNFIGKFYTLRVWTEQSLQ